MIKVTFDKNVYEFVVDPEKPGIVSLEERNVYRQIHKLILNKKITPFISESILTYEVLSKEIRQKILSNNQPLLISHEDGSITISSNPKIHPGNHPKDNLYLPKAILMGFKVLPGARFGKLINLELKPDWYYRLIEDYLETTQRFSNVVRTIENMGGGYKYYRQVIETDKYPHLTTFEVIRLYNGTEKKFSAAISEWSDGDSVGLHIAYRLDYFCTNDQGKSAGDKSVFSSRICNILSVIATI